MRGKILLNAHRLLRLRSTHSADSCAMLMDAGNDAFTLMFIKKFAFVSNTNSGKNSEKFMNR